MNKDDGATGFDTPCPKVGEACRTLIEVGEKVTLRNVASRVGVAHTTLSRDADRKAQISRWQTLQETAERVRNSQRGRVPSDESVPMARLKLRLKTAEDNVALLVASHRAMFMAVGELGGMRAWRQFFEFHKASLARLEEIGAFPHHRDGSGV